MTEEEILPPQQQRIIQEAKCPYLPLRKGLEKQANTVDKHGEKQVEGMRPLDVTHKRTELKLN